ncbi:MAG: MFS transporter [Candidatus Hodarchaeota archaeon]
MKQIDKLIYGSARFGSSILLNLMTIATLYIYTLHFNLYGPFTGLGVGLGELTIALSGFMMGYISDATPTRISRLFGGSRRRPYIFVGAPGLAFTFVMLFIPYLFIPLGNQLLVFIYLTIFSCGFKFFYGFLMTPYQAWLPEITADSNERVEVSGYQNTANLLATVMGFALGLLVIPTILGSESEPMDLMGDAGRILLVMVVFLALLEVLLYIPTFLRINERGKYLDQPSLIEQVKIAFKNRDYVFWICAQGVMSVGFTILMKTIINYAQGILRFSTLEYIIFGLLLFIFVFLSFVFWGKLASKPKYRKKKSLIFALLLMVVVLPFTLVVGQLPIIPITLQGYALVALVGTGVSGYYLFPYAIVADLAEADEIVTGEGRAGAYSGFLSIPINVAGFFGSFIAGVLVEPTIWGTLYAGIEESSLGLLWLGPVSALFIFLGILVLLKANIDPDLGELRKKYNHLRN